MTQTHVFAISLPIQSDQTTPPNMTTPQLKAAMALVYNHMLKLEVATADDLAAALATLAVAANNENWCIYVP